MALIALALAASAAPEQHVFKVTEEAPQDPAQSWRQPIRQLTESLNSLTEDAQNLWDEVALMFPDALNKANFLSSPKSHKRKHDSEWDYIVRGEEIQSVWVKDNRGERRRKIDGKLANYDMRIKAVDPTALGVDSVKQYSGYLDDKEDDKHLFYCEWQWV